MPIRLALVRAIAAALGPAHTESEVADAVLEAVTTYLEATMSVLWLATPDGTELELGYQHNAHPEAVARFAVMSLDEPAPPPAVLRSGEAVFLRSRAERAERWPAVADSPSRSEAVAVLPLEIDGDRLGVLSIGFPEERDFDSEDRVALMAVADQAAIALDRARLYQAARAGADANHLLARVSGLIGEIHDWAALAQRAAAACTDHFVDTCAIYVREGNLVRRVAAASRSYGKLARGLVDRFPTPASSEVPTTQAIRTGQAVRVPAITSQLIAAVSPSAEYRARVTGADLRFGDAWVLPLRAGSRCFGAMLFAAGPGVVFDRADLRLARQVAERTADVLRSASVFAEQRATVQTLHEVLLPASLPEVPGVELATSYVPQARTGEVGGDWWEALRLPDGRIGLSVGDVAGHGVPAAAVMGQLRNALRLQLVSGAGPAGALDSLSRLLDWTHPAAHATAIVAVLDPVSGALEWSAAGHPPPLVIDVDGGRRLVEPDRAPPLGLVRPGAYPTARLVLDRSAVLCLYTDGLVEGRGRDLDTGFAELLEAGRHLTNPDLQRGCDRLLASLVDQPDDDVCVLAVRRGA